MARQTTREKNDARNDTESVARDADQVQKERLAYGRQALEAKSVLAQEWVTTCRVATAPPGFYISTSVRSEATSQI